MSAPRVRIAAPRGGTRLEWTVFEWNTQAIALYERLGGKVLADLRVYRLDRAALETIAAGEPPVV